MRAEPVRDSDRQTWLELDFKLMRTGAVVREEKKTFSWHHGRVAKGTPGSWPGLNTKPVQGRAPTNTPILGYLVEESRSEQNTHTHAKQKVLEKQRILCCAWQLP